MKTTPDRKVNIQITDEFLTAESTDKDANSEVQIAYRRMHYPGAAADGTPEWRDCVEVMIEGLAMTVRNSLMDRMLCENAAELLADRLQARVRELCIDIPGKDSSAYRHIPGVMNLH